MSRIMDPQAFGRVAVLMGGTSSEREVSLDSGKGTVESARTIGVGLSPGDENISEPYFYVTPWPYPPPAKLPKLPEIGAWYVIRNVRRLLLKFEGANDAW